MEGKFSKVFTVYTKARTREYGSSQHVPPPCYNSIARQTPKTVASDVKEAEICNQLLKSLPHDVSRGPESRLPTVLSLGVSSATCFQDGCQLAAVLHTFNARNRSRVTSRVHTH